MKRAHVYFFAVLGITLFGNCSPDEVVSWNTSYEYTIMDIMETEISAHHDSESYAIGSNGFTTGNKVMTGTQVVGCSSGYVDKQQVGLTIHLAYEFSGEMFEDDFSEEMFQVLWSEGTIHKLGVDKDPLRKESLVYIGIKTEEGTLKKYITEVNASEDNSRMEILSREYVGKSSKERDVYKIKVKFESRMVNMDDAMDVLYLKGGFATLKVSNFASDPPK